jgi:hypothetical protein
MRYLFTGELYSVTIYMNYLNIFLCETNLDSPAFVFPKGSGVVPVTYYVYNRYIKYFLNLIGLDTKLYSSHSFLRGGATFRLRFRVNLFRFTKIGRVTHIKFYE